VTIPPALDLTTSRDRDADAPRSTYPVPRGTPNETTDGTPITPVRNLVIYHPFATTPVPGTGQQPNAATRRERAKRATLRRTNAEIARNASTHFYTKKMGEATAIKRPPKIPKNFEG